MNPKLPAVKNLLSFRHIQLLFFSVAFLVLSFNGIRLNKKLVEMKETRKEQPFIFIGVKFSGIKEIIGDMDYIGYYTDRNLDEHATAMQFAQAQYVLAPIILEYNNLQHPYILFDCTDTKVALAKIQEIGAFPLRQNQFGIILAKNMKVSAP